MVWTFIVSGGWPMVPILACSVIALALLFERGWFWLFVWAGRDKKLRREMLGPGFDRRRALVSPDPVCQVLLALHREPDDPTQATTLADRIVTETREPLPILLTVAAVSTSLGLFGTVVGVALAFQRLGASPGLAELVPALSVALNTTVLGLIVYVPTYIGAQISQMASNGLAFEMEQGLNTLQAALRRQAIAAEGAA